MTDNLNENKSVNFEELESLYIHLESEAISYKDLYNIASLFSKLLDKLGEDSKDSKKITWEIGFFYLIITDNEIKSKIENFGFTNDTYLYLKERQKKTQNPLLKSHYSHILWLSPFKEIEYAQDSVSSYLMLIKIFERQHILNPDNHFGSNIFNAVQNGFLISKQINYNITNTKFEIIRLIKTLENLNVASTILKIRLIKLILKNNKSFEQTELTILPKICWDIAEYLINTKHYHEGIQVLETGQKTAIIINDKTIEWYNRIAQCYESLMEYAEFSNEPSAPDYCLKALNIYKRLKDNNKIHLLESKYPTLKNKVKYGAFSTEIDLTEHIDYCKEIAIKFAKLDTQNILINLAMDKKLLPTNEELNKYIDEEKIIGPFHYILPKSVIDQNGHNSQHFSEPEELEYYSRLINYQNILSSNKIHLINEIIMTTVREKKLSFELFIEHMESKSWLGRDFPKHYPNNQIIQIKWLDYFAPGIKEYFFEINNIISDSTYTPSLITCIDSLCIKLEGALRDLCYISNIPTFYQTKDKKGRDITREKDINALLYEKELQNKFSKDDLLFFKVLLVEKAGYNLRNLIAHSLLSIENYNLAFAHLLFIAILKIGAFMITFKENQ